MMSDNSRQFRVLVLDPHLNMRSLIQSQLKRSGFVEELTCARTASELEKALRDANFFDVVMIAEGFNELEKSRIDALLETCFATQQSSRVLVARESVTRRSLMAKLLEGFDAVLLAPFSIEEVQRVLTLATESSLREDQSRTKILASMLLKEVRSFHKDLVTKKRGGFRASVSTRVGQEIAFTLRSLPNHAKVSFLDELIHDYIDKPGRPRAVPTSVPLSERVAGYA